MRTRKRSYSWTYQQRQAPHDCALRLRAGEVTFDADWELDLTQRAGGVAAIASVPAGGSSIWMKVFEPSAFSGVVPVAEIDWGLEAWRWGLLDVESDDPIRLDQQADLVSPTGTRSSWTGALSRPSQTRTIPRRR
jgi:hypothetical protein